LEPRHDHEEAEMKIAAIGRANVGGRPARGGLGRFFYGTAAPGEL
jgi:hypothetical protein